MRYTVFYFCKKTLFNVYWRMHSKLSCNTYQILVESEFRQRGLFSPIHWKWENMGQFLAIVKKIQVERKLKLNPKTQFLSKIIEICIFFWKILNSIYKKNSRKKLKTQWENLSNKLKVSAHSCWQWGKYGHEISQLNGRLNNGIMSLMKE